MGLLKLYYVYLNWGHQFLPQLIIEGFFFLLDVIGCFKWSKTQSDLQLSQCWLLSKTLICCLFPWFMCLFPLFCWFKVQGWNTCEKNLLFCQPLHAQKTLFLALFHLGEVYFFAFLLSSIHLFDIAMGTVPPLSHIATGCQAVITVTSSLPTTPCGPVRCRGCWTTKYRHTNTLGQWCTQK